MGDARRVASADTVAADAAVANADLPLLVAELELT
jgi:hypothetical protein